MPKFSKALFNKVCNRIANGESLRAVCEDKQMPSVFSFLKWVKNDSDLAAQYAHAREAQAEYFAADIVNIADTEADPQKARVMIDARKWTASKLLPKKYGDRVTVDTTDSMMDRFARAMSREQK